MEIKVTADGSHTLYVPSLNEHYHSVHGAMMESEHVFIRNGFNNLPADLSPVHIFEVGFGTGLNALLTMQEAVKQNRKIIYHSIEAYPLSSEIWTKLNYNSPDFSTLHSCEWDQDVNITPYFTLRKIKADLPQFINGTPSPIFDLIYFDAFGPDVQPEMWKPEIFSFLFRMMKDEGIIVTYSVKGDVKRAMRSAGYKTERLPGPPGKREMLRGRKLQILS